MASHDFRAVKRYATALFEAALKANVLEAVESDLQTIADLLRDTPALRHMWDSPLIPGGKKRDLVGRIFGETVNPLSLAFLRLLVDKRREDIIDAVPNEIRLLADQSRHMVRAEATFAVTPSSTEEADLQRSLEQRTGGHVTLTIQVDPDILGGVVVRMQDTVLDGSVRGALERLREHLLQEA